MLQTQWNWFLSTTNMASFILPAGGSVSIPAGSGIPMAYMGGAFAFILSMIGALMNLAKVVYYVEGSIDDWLYGWEKGKYEKIIENPDGDMYDAMNLFLTGYTGDIILWSLAAVWHTGFIIASGYIAAFWILFSNMCCKKDTQTAVNTYLGTVPVRYGWKAMLFGIIVGSINFLSGSIMKSTAQSVMNMLGYLDHTETGDNNKQITTTTNYNSVNTVTVVNTEPEDDYGYNFKALLDLQQNWFVFYVTIRASQLAAPYLFLLTVEGAMVITFLLFFIYY
jgi:hypothetical protein